MPNDSKNLLRHVLELDDVSAALSHKDEMSQEVHELFWAQPQNALAMHRLGYYK